MLEHNLNKQIVLSQNESTLVITIYDDLLNEVI